MDGSLGRSGYPAPDRGGILWQGGPPDASVPPPPPPPVFCRMWSAGNAVRLPDGSAAVAMAAAAQCWHNPASCRVCTKRADLEEQLRLLHSTCVCGVQVYAAQWRHTRVAVKVRAVFFLSSSFICYVFFLITWRATGDGVDHSSSLLLCTRTPPCLQLLLAPETQALLTIGGAAASTLLSPILSDLQKVRRLTAVVIA